MNRSPIARFIRLRILLATATLCTMGIHCLKAQDPVQDLNKSLRTATSDMFGFTFEERTRWEEKDGVNFGKSVNQQDMLSRLRIGANFTPVSWFTISAMGQDVRAPFYGTGAPNTIRDTMDLQEGYIRFLANIKPALGASSAARCSISVSPG